MDYRYRGVDGIDVRSRVDPLCKRRKSSLRTSVECKIWRRVIDVEKRKLSSAKAGRVAGLKTTENNAELHSKCSAQIVIIYQTPEKTTLS